jgi:hypothetical protein
MNKKLSEAVSEIIEQLTGEEPHPDTVARLSTEPSGADQVGLTELQKQQLGDIVTRSEQV